MRQLCLQAIALLLLCGCGRSQPAVELAPDASWEQVGQAARGVTVRMAMWQGDPLINAYMRDYVAPALQSQHGITLETVSGHGSELVSRMTVDLEASRTVGDIDVVWINGATFYQLRQLNALEGPFTDRLPHRELIDWQDPFIATDFQQPVEGFECPWGSVQFCLIHHKERVPEPPRTREALTEWIRQHPSRFTWDVDFTGMTFLKCLLTEFAGGPAALDGPYDDAKYQAAASQLWAWVREVRPQLWREGRTFPEGVAQLHQLFSNGEVDFTMSNNNGEVDNKVLQGVLPDAARGYVLDHGTIRNTHYLGIPRNAPNKAAALVLINFLISPDAQLKKATPEVWGDGSVLSLAKLDADWQQRFRQIPGRARVPSREELATHAIREPAPEIMIRLHEDFRREIIDHAP